MLKKTALLASATILSLVAACANDNGEARHKHAYEPGKYDKTTSYVDSEGTEYETKDSRSVERDKYGNEKVVIDQQTTKDPKGFGNKKTIHKKKVIINDEDTNQ
jgi:hypothetical protein